MHSLSGPRLPSTRPLWYRIVRLLLVVLASLYLIGTVVGGSALGWIALHPPVRPITPMELAAVQTRTRADSQEFSNVAVTTPDGVTLRAWFVRPREWNGDAVLLLHGVSDNRLGMEGYGEWLLRKRYAVLLPDARAHGESGGLATYGLQEADDIHRWASWLEDTYHPRCLYGLGESMGAAQVLQSLAREPRFCAVVAESPFASFREVAYARIGRRFNTGPWLGQTFFWPTVEMGFLFVRFRYGFDMESASPKRAVERTKVPVLLIHGLDDTNIPPFHSDEIQQHNPANVTVWKVPGAAHTGASTAAPEEFEKRVLGWFAEHRANAAK